MSAPRAESLGSLQIRAHRWSLEKWPNEGVMHDALGLGEEVGEVLRCVLKREHGTRGTAEEWTAELRKEVGDTLLVLAVLAEREGFDLLDAAWDRWLAIKDRSVNHDPIVTAP